MKTYSEVSFNMYRLFETRSSFYNVFLFYDDKHYLILVSLWENKYIRIKCSTKIVRANIILLIMRCLTSKSKLKNIQQELEQVTKGVIWVCMNACNENVSYMLRW